MVILSLAVPPKPCTQSAGRGLARERASRGIPLGGSCATSTRTGPSDTYGRSPESETRERDETEPWALSYRMPCIQHKLISRYRTRGLWGLIGAPSRSRSVCSTATVAWWVHGPWTMMEPVWRSWRLGCGPLSVGQPQRVSVALEVPRGAIVEGRLERGFHVLAIHPKQLDRFRDRHSVAGAKDDRRDAFVLADSVRTDRPSFRRLHLDAPHLLLLRELSCVEETLLEAFRRSANR